MPYRIRAMLLAFIVVFVLVGCSAPAATQPPASATPAAQPASALPSAAKATAVPASAAAPLTIADDLGRTVTLSTMPQRIVSLAPSATEILFAVGAGPQVVGNTEYCNYPPEADALPEIGGFSTKSISIESIVGLQPDLVIAGTASQMPVVESLEQLDIPVLVLAPDSFEAVYQSIKQIGILTGHATEADEVVATMEKRVEAVTSKVATIPASERPSVFWEVYDEPLMTSGPQTFIGQMIELAGATNVFADATEDYPQISAETVAERDPMVILGPSSHKDKLEVEQITQRPGWSDIRAVQDGRVYTLDADMTSRPGPRLADALEALAKVLYPETFK